MSLTNEQLTAMETGAPLLVAEYRKLLVDQETAYHEMLADQKKLGAYCSLVRSLVYTLRSGVIAHSTVSELSERAKELGAFP